MRVSRCKQCGRLVAVVNYDKLHGRVGLTMAWMHVTRHGRIKRLTTHAPVVDDD